MRKGSASQLRWSSLKKHFERFSLGTAWQRFPRLPGVEVVQEFLEDWYFSRPFHYVYLSLPASLAVVGVIVLCSEAAFTSSERLIREYEQRAEQLRGVGDVRGQELCFRAAAELDRNNPIHRVRLGMLLDNSGRTDAARQQMQLAAEVPNSTMPEASLWLARDLLRSGSSAAALHEAERRFLESIEISPRNDAVRRELVAFFEARGETLLAQHSLEESARIRPLNYPALLQWLLQHRISPRQIEQTISRAVQTLDEQILNSPADETLRIALSEVHVVTGNFAAAEKALGDLRAVEEYSPAMRGAWSSLRLLQSQWLLQQSPLSRDAVIPLLAESLACDPFYADALELAESLFEGGLRFPADSLTRPLQTLRTLLADNRDEWNTRSTLFRLQLLTGYKPPKDDLPAEPALPQHRLQYARLLHKSGHIAFAQQTAKQLLEDLQQTPDEDPRQLLTASCLLLLNQPAKVLLITQLETQSADKLPPPAVRHLHSQASLQLFDQTFPTNGSHTPPNAASENTVSLLRPVLDDPAFAFAALERLARLSLQTSSAATSAAEILAELRSHGRFTVEIPSMLGVYAIQSKQYAVAVRYLTAAHAVTRSFDAGLQNNLALALVREDPDHAEEALELVNVALDAHPRHPDLLTTRGEICAALERWPEAVEDLTAALPARRADPQLQSLLEKAWTAMKLRRDSGRMRRSTAELRQLREQRQQYATSTAGSDVPNQQLPAEKP